MGLDDKDIKKMEDKLEKAQAKLKEDDDMRRISLLVK